MRTIKFRGRDFAGAWWYGYPSLYEDNPVIHPLQCVGASMLVDEDTVGQFTGLTDKNGKEIYEGDIIMINLTDGSIAVSSVVWNRRGYWGCDIDINHGVQLGLIDKVRIEVIGNIHDNPELINKPTND